MSQGAASAGPRASMRPTQLYDVAVVGSDLAGLIAGALLAKRGLRVLQIDHGSPYSHWSAGGFRLPSGIDLYPPLRSIPAFHALFQDLGNLPATLRMLQPYAAGLQLVLPGTRLAFPPDPEHRRKELDRAFGGAAAQQLATVLERTLQLQEKGGELLAGDPPLPPGGLFERYRIRRLARKARALTELPLDKGDPLGRALLELHRHLSAQAAGPTTLGFLRASLPMLLEPSRFEGTGLIELLRASIQGHRGDALGSPGAPAQVEELVLERGRFAGVRLAGQASPHRARLCLASTRTAAVLDALPPSRIRRRFERFDARITASQRIYTQNLVLAEEGIPPGMGELVFASGVGPSPLLIQVEPAVLASGEPAPALRTVTVSTLVPASEPPEASDAKLRQGLEEVMPFHERHLRHRGTAPTRHLRFAPAAEAEGTASALDSAPLQTPIPRLLLTNASVLPGLGLEGALLTGMRAAHLAQEQIQKVRPS